MTKLLEKAISRIRELPEDRQDELAEMLIEAAPDLFSRPAYLWPSGWVAMSLADPDIDWAHVEARLLTSWRLAAPKRLAGI